ncbi:head-tail connector protein [Lacticaseibacillus songhuajiangensis]|uniref:hypothetical protein n=1 Tax=Lacticaseibacillus songhuajiangensis TaxID=1296539 RepID=UPI000F7B5BE6|nr:hypothetical protein [Lacticaseibacillus songhuajiangensis]
MAYVTQDEYIQAMHVVDAPDGFDRLEARAEDYLDDLTRNYYRYHELADDRFPLRATRFKRAIMRQIEYMATSGITSQDQASRQEASEQQVMGRTTVTKTYQTAGGLDTTAMSVISADAIAALSGTGLLYRGIPYARY